MKRKLKLGQIAGINLYVHWTFLLLILYIVYINYRAGNSTVSTIWSVVFILTIFITVLLHELGHALTAKRFKIKTIDITLLPIGGIAHIESIPEKPIEELLITLAGPAVNIALAIITYFFITIPDSQELIIQLTKGVNADNFFLTFFLVNIWLAIFNLIPAFPMDGGRILRAILAMIFPRTTATLIAARIGQVIALGFIVLGFYSNPFLIFIGIFIMISAQLESDFTQSKSLLQGYFVKDVIMKDYKSLDKNDIVKTAVIRLLDSQIKNFIVTDKNEPVGTLNRDEIIKALSQFGEDVTIEDVMNKNITFLNSESPLEKVYEISQQSKSNIMPVVENNQIIGIVDMENILEFLLIKKAKAI